MTKEETIEEVIKSRTNSSKELDTDSEVVKMFKKSYLTKTELYIDSYEIVDGMIKIKFTKIIGDDVEGDSWYKNLRTNDDFIVEPISNNLMWAERLNNNQYHFDNLFKSNDVLILKSKNTKK
jgi:hypothetical protein